MAELVTVNKAPIVVTDIDELGDKRLNPEEGLARAKETSLAMAEKNKIPNQSAFEDIAAALGRPLPWNEIIRRVVNINPFVMFGDGGVRDAIAVRYTVNGDPLSYVTGFYKETMPEYSAVLTDEKGVAKREIRGWRQVLLQLIKVGALTREKIRKEFGPATGQRSQWWDELARKYEEELKIQ